MKQWLEGHQFRCATHAQPTRLRQVIAERGHYHVLLGVRSAAYTSPDITNDVGELWTPLNSALRSVIELVVEPCRVFEKTFSIVVAISSNAGGESIASGRNCLSETPVIPEELRAVADGGCTRCSGLPISGNILATTIEVNVDFGIVDFKRSETLVRVQ